MTVFDPSETGEGDFPRPADPPPGPKNPSVFPAVYAHGGPTARGQEFTVEVGGGGLKLRDFFAAQVAAGLAAQAGVRATTPSDFAAVAFALADALLAHSRGEGKGCPHGG